MDLAFFHVLNSYLLPPFHMSEGYVKTYEHQSDSSLLILSKVIVNDKDDFPVVAKCSYHKTGEAREKYLRFISVYQKNGARKHRCAKMFSSQLPWEKNVD